MRWRASPDADTNPDRATESYGIRHEGPYLDGHTNRCAGAADADATDTSGANANCDAYANAHRDRNSDRDTSGRVA